MNSHTFHPVKPTMNKETSIFSRLSPKSIEILKSINPKYKNIDKVSPYDVLVAISSIDPSLMELLKDIHFTPKSEKKMFLLSDWLVDAYREAYSASSEVVDAYHLILAFLLRIDKDVYYKVKKEYQNQYKFTETIGLKPYYKDFSKSYLDEDHIFIGRERELTKLIVNLTASKSKPVLLLGSKGVGKTTLIKELAKRIDEKKVPKELQKTKIIKVHYNLLINVIPSDTNVPIQALFSHVLSSIASANSKNNEKLILFIDDIKFKNNYFVAFEETEANSDVLIIGAVDEIPNKIWENTENPISQMWEIIEFDDMKTDIHQKILIEHINQDKNLESFDYTEEAVTKIIEYYKNNFMFDSLPGKAIHTLELIGLYKKLQKDVKKSDGKNDRKNKGNNRKNKRKVRSQGAQEVASVSNFKPLLNKSKENLYETSIKLNKKVKLDEVSTDLILVTSNDVKEYLGVIDTDQVTNKDKDDLYKIDVFDIEKYLKKVVIGQDEAIEALSRALRISSMKLMSSNKPIGTFLFLGPTGVGKTYMAKQLAGALFGFRDKDKVNPKKFLRVDMSEYSEKHTVSKLFGAPPGYIGYDDSSVLIDFVVDNLKSVILFDEIDKAHPNVLNSLLHIMEEGEIRANTGEMVSFTDTIIIMTSNHGAELIDKVNVGFTNDSGVFVRNYEEIKVELLENLKKTVKPEFLNRFDDIVIFRPLNDKDLVKILDIMLKPIIEKLYLNDVRLVVSDRAKKLIIKKSNQIEYGARELRRTLNKEIIDPISHILYKNRNVKTIRVSTKGDTLKFTHK